MISKRKQYRYSFGVKARALQLRARGMTYRQVAAVVGVLCPATIRTWYLCYVNDDEFYDAVNQAAEGGL